MDVSDDRELNFRDVLDDGRPASYSPEGLAGNEPLHDQDLLIFRTERHIDDPGGDANDIEVRFGGTRCRRLRHIRDTPRPNPSRHSPANPLKPFCTKGFPAPGVGLEPTTNGLTVRSDTSRQFPTSRKNAYTAQTSDNRGTQHLAAPLIGSGRFRDTCATRAINCSFEVPGGRRPRDGRQWLCDPRARRS